MKAAGKDNSLQDTSIEIEVSLEEEAQHRYLSYALSVITSRALPDVRDGLKPVQRRILYAMYHDQHLLPDAKYRKCASVVGDVLGKYHPHGDQSVYDALVRMGQDFSLRYPLVDGYGNFGSQDGDPAAAYRYTECRLRPFSMTLLEELRQNTTSVRPTFDGTRNEPSVLPAQMPNLLLNGTQGIAVGMATAIPPHNAKEILSACIKLIDDPDTTTSELMNSIKGPDFPTGGVMRITEEELLGIYEKGHGAIALQGSYQVETRKEDRHMRTIVIDSIPYGIDRSEIMKQIGEIVTEKKLPWLLGCKDESSEQLRITIEVKPDTDIKTLMAYLYKHTQLEIQVQINLTCLVPGEQSEICTPKQLSLRECLVAFLQFRLEVVTKKISFQLETLLRRIHILEGFVQIFDSLDEVLGMVRQSGGKAEAAKQIQRRFSLDEEQTNAILETKIYQLARLEMDTIRKELSTKEKERAVVSALLESKSMRFALIRDELVALQKEYGDKRRTFREKRVAEPTIGDLVFPKEETLVVITKEGWIRRMGKIRDLASIKVKDGDEVLDVLEASTRDKILFFTNVGFAHITKISEIPWSSGYGEPIQTFFKWNDGEQLIRAVIIPEKQGRDVMKFVSVTETGMGAFFSWSHPEILSMRKSRSFLKNTNKDTVIGILPVKEGAKITLVTKDGFFTIWTWKDGKIKEGHPVKLLMLKKDDLVCIASTAPLLEVKDTQGNVFTVMSKGKKELPQGELKKLKTPGTIVKRSGWDVSIPKQEKKLRPGS